VIGCIDLKLERIGEIWHKALVSIMKGSEDKEGTDEEEEETERAEEMERAMGLRGRGEGLARQT
jgi:hypothetical protein